MGNNEENKRSEEFVRIYFIISGGIIILFIMLGVIEIDVVIERAIRILGFWFLLFVSIFVPRRILKRSKKFRCIVLHIRKKYPLIFYYRSKIKIIEGVNFFFWYTAFYLERILKYFLVGTKIKWLSPYRKNMERGEFWILIILEGYRWVHYVVLYVLQIFYEIIKFFDNATIYKIIRSKILGFMMVTIGYIIIGVKFFICYVISMLIIAGVYYTLNIYVTYKEWMKKYPWAGSLSNLQCVLIVRGFVNKLEYFAKFEIDELRHKTILIFDVIKYRRAFNFLKSIKRKYGLKRVTKCWLSINALSEVEEKTLIAIRFLDLKEEEKEKIKIIEISRFKFTTNFLKKKKWYTADSIVDPLNATVYDNFTNAFEMFDRKFYNFLEFKVYFMFWFISCFCDFEGEVWKEEKEDEEDEKDEKDEMYVDFWKDSKVLKEFYLGNLKEYFEFRDIYKFVKEVEKKIFEREKNLIKFYDKYVIKANLWFMLKTYHIAYQHDKIITKEEYECLKFIIHLIFMNNLGFEINEKELGELFEKYNYMEILEGLKEKGYFVKHFDKLKWKKF